MKAWKLSQARRKGPTKWLISQGSKWVTCQCWSLSVSYICHAWYLMHFYLYPQRRKSCHWRSLLPSSTLEYSFGFSFFSSFAKQTWPNGIFHWKEACLRRLARFGDSTPQQEEGFLRQLSHSAVLVPGRCFTVQCSTSVESVRNTKQFEIWNLKESWQSTRVGCLFWFRPDNVMWCLFICAPVESAQSAQLRVYATQNSLSSES